MQNDKNTKLKFYLRGVATGVALSVALMGIVINLQNKSGKDPGKTVTGQESLESSQGGMELVESKPIEESSSSEIPETQESLESTEPSETSKAPENTEVSDLPESTEPEETTEPSESVEPSQPEESSEQSEPSESIEPSQSEEPETSSWEDGEYVVIIIKRGYSSYTVAKILAENGLVADANAYDAYLCRHGYDHSISVGEFKIMRGSTEEEIARIITNSN